MNKLKITSIKINASENPRLYIWSDEDIEIFINNLITSYKEKDKITKPVVQLLYVIMQYLIYFTRPNDDNLFANMGKLLNAFERGAFDVHGAFNIIFTDLSMEDDEYAQKTYRNYILFRDMCRRDPSIDLGEITATAKRIAVEHAANISSDITLKHLRITDSPRHVRVETEAGTTYEFYLFRRNMNNIVVKNVDRNDKENLITASVYAIHPFLYNFDNKPSVNKKFLQQVIGMCNEKLDKDQIKLQWVVKNAFKDDYNVDLDSINEYDPNRTYKNAGRKETCVHEASHAVTHWLFNEKIVEATVQRDEKWGGYVEPELDIRRSISFESMLPSVICYYAGDLAQKNKNDKSLYWTKEETTQDVKYATDYAKQYVIETVPTLDQRFIDYERLGVPRTFWVAYKTSLLCEYLYKRAEEIVNANRDLIDALAAQLYEKTTMTGDKIDTFLTTIDPTRKGSLLAILPEEEKTISAILNPNQTPKPNSEPQTAT